MARLLGKNANMFGTLKKAASWLRKYRDDPALPEDLRRRVKYFRAAQPIALVAAGAWTFYPTVALAIPCVLGVVALIAMNRSIEPKLDRAIAQYKKRDTLSPLERAKELYLSLPEGDPRVEQAQAAYLAEMEKAKTGTAPSVSAPKAVPAPMPKADPVVALKIAEAKYLALADNDPRLPAAMQEYLKAQEEANKLS
jgi:hypothetical protein